ncbi:MAG: glycosyl hydrolase, partial [Bacteroidota bacterium]
GGLHWTDVSMKELQVHYGFALCVDPVDPLRAWVIPAISDEIRVAAGRTLCVCTTEDGGQHWRVLRRGLPQENCYDIVFRHAFANKAHQMAFGTTTGNLFCSQDNGEHWQNLSNYLPRINCVVFS